MTRLSPSGIPGIAYGSFAGKTEQAVPADNIIHLAPHGVPGGVYSFLPKAAATVAIDEVVSGGSTGRTSERQRQRDYNEAERKRRAQQKNPQKTRKATKTRKKTKKQRQYARWIENLQETTAVQPVESVSTPQQREIARLTVEDVIERLNEPRYTPPPPPPYEVPDKILDILDPIEIPDPPPPPPPVLIDPVLAADIVPMAQRYPEIYRLQQAAKAAEDEAIEILLLAA